MVEAKSDGGEATCRHRCRMRGHVGSAEESNAACQRSRRTDFTTDPRRVKQLSEVASDRSHHRPTSARNSSDKILSNELFRRCSSFASEG
eukprot:9480067-Pyramimonas_sp.AAC.1